MLRCNVGSPELHCNITILRCTKLRPQWCFGDGQSLEWRVQCQQEWFSGGVKLNQTVPKNVSLFWGAGSMQRAGDTRPHSTFLAGA